MSGEHNHNNFDFVVDPNQNHLGFISHERGEGVSVVIERRRVTVYTSAGGKKLDFVVDPN